MRIAVHQQLHLDALGQGIEGLEDSAANLVLTNCNWSAVESVWK